MMGTVVVSSDPRFGPWKRHTFDGELGALLEETKTLRARAGTEEVAKGTSEDTAVNVGGVTSVGGLVAARQLSLVTTLGLGLLDGNVIGDREANVAVALVAVAVGNAVAVATSRGGSAGEGHDGGSEGKDSSSDGELHCDGGFGIERELELGVLGKTGLGERERER